MYFWIYFLHFEVKSLGAFFVNVTNTRTSFSMLEHHNQNVRYEQNCASAEQYHIHCPKRNFRTADVQVAVETVQKRLLTFSWQAKLAEFIYVATHKMFTQNANAIRTGKTAYNIAHTLGEL